MWLKILFLVTISACNIVADTIKLKNGKIFENVKTEIQSESVIITDNGVQKIFPKSAVASVKLKPILSKTENLKLETKNIDSELTNERIRIAESLQNQFDWETEIGSKPRLAIINFQAGSGVQNGELETIIEIIITNLVKTNLFEIIDKQTLARTKLEQEKYNEDCKKGLKDCSNKLGELLNANRILTGKVTKIESRYFINGSIIDPVQNKIDFAESEIAFNANMIPSASEKFAKKVAGGILEYFDVEYKSKFSIKNFSYIKNSALFPGYGQYLYSVDRKQNSQKYKSYLFNGIFIGLILQNIISYQSYLEEQENYKQSQNLFLVSWNTPIDLITLYNENYRYKELVESKKESQSALSLLAIFYIINLADAYFLPSNSKSETNLYFLKLDTHLRSHSLYSYQKENIFNVEYGLRF
ncbi:MAG: hypothetical protein SH817_12055 [Leptospira sp.]|nr:hypothetical protein [Leptospira sp.]